MRSRVAVFTVVGVLLCAVLGVALATGAGARTTAYFTGHCKQADHLREVAAPAGATLIPNSAVHVYTQTATDDLECVNDPDYRGVVYMIGVDNHPDINLLPDGAAEVKTAFAFLAAYSVNCELEHTNGGSYFVFGDFSYQTCGAIAYVLLLLGA